MDRALKRLYRLDSLLCAEDFLMTRPSSGATIANGNLKGALYVKSSENDVSLGIYLSAPVRRKLTVFPKGLASEWPHDILEAYTVALEEVSHFHCLLHHTTEGRQVSPLDLELQGEIDKFLVTFFTNNDQKNAANFERLYVRLFQEFSLSSDLSALQRERYLEANRLAMRFIRRHEALLLQSDSAFALARLRKFYRMSGREKIRIISY